MNNIYDKLSKEELIYLIEQRDNIIEKGTSIKRMKFLVRSLRVKKGLENALSNGKKLGRPGVITKEIEKQILILNDKGFSGRSISKIADVSTGTISRFLNSLKEKSTTQKPLNTMQRLNKLEKMFEDLERGQNGIT